MEICAFRLDFTCKRVYDIAGSAHQNIEPQHGYVKMNSIDLKNISGTDWRSMPPDERKRALFHKQKDLLDTFMSRGAIDRRQYEKSLTCMAEKMGIALDGHKLN